MVVKKFVHHICGFRLKVLCFGLFCCLWSCQSDGPANMNVELAGVSEHWERFDQQISGLDTLQLLRHVRQLESDRPILTNIYFKQILRLAPPIDTLILQEDVLKGFLKAPIVSMIHESISSVYGKSVEMPEDLRKAIGYYAYYFPERDTPAVYTVNTEFGYFPFLFEDAQRRDAIGIGLDMFLGEDFPYESLSQQSPVFSEYNLSVFDPKYLPKKSIEVLVDDVVETPRNDRLIDLMIYQGVKLYWLHKLMPWMEEEILFEYSSEQLRWCQTNETEIWRFLIGEDLLYSSKNTHKYTEPAPTSIGMPPEAPGRVANWIGYQIIRSYIRNEGTDAAYSLLSLKDGQKLLEKSKYKPKR